MRVIGTSGRNQSVPLGRCEQEGEVFDPFSETEPCRVIGCSEGFKFSEGKCVQDGSTTPEVFTTTPTTSGLTKTVPITTATHTTPETTTTYVSPSSVRVNTTNTTLNDDVTSGPIHLLPESTTTRPPRSTQPGKINKKHKNKTTTIGWVVYYASRKPVVADSADRVNDARNDDDDDKNDLPVMTETPKKDLIEHASTSAAVRLDCHEWMEVDEDDYKILDNRSVIVRSAAAAGFQIQQRMYAPNEYEFKTSNDDGLTSLLRLCVRDPHGTAPGPGAARQPANDLERRPATEPGRQRQPMSSDDDDNGDYNNGTKMKSRPDLIVMFRFDRIQTLTSFVASIVSITASTVTCFTFILVPRLRSSIDGKCIICLVVSLIFAQLTYLLATLSIIGTPKGDRSNPLNSTLVSDSRPSIGDVCYWMAVCMHYFWLVALFWINVLAIEITRRSLNATKRMNGEPAGTTATKRMNGTGENMASDRQGHGAMLALYSLYAWLTPASLVAVCVVIDLLPDNGWVSAIRPYYGQLGVCWMTGYWALLLFFAFPIALWTFIDLVLLMTATCRLCCCPVTTSDWHDEDDEGLRKDRHYLAFYFFLAVLVCLLWSAAFVATYFELAYLWHAFIAMMALIGVALCLAFICNRSVFKLLTRGRRFDGDPPLENKRPLIHNYYSHPDRKNKNKPIPPPETFRTEVISQETSI